MTQLAEFHAQYFVHVQDASDNTDPAAALKLLDASAAVAAATQVARAGVALHDGLLAEAKQLKEARARALAAALDTDMVSGVSSLANSAAGPWLMYGVTQQHTRQYACQSAVMMLGDVVKQLTMLLHCMPVYACCTPPAINGVPVTCRSGQV